MRLRSFGLWSRRCATWGSRMLRLGLGESKRPSAAQNRPAWRPAFEVLEDRMVPSVTVHGDFNGDGIQDTAIGEPTATVNGLANAGDVRIIYGTANGSPGRVQIITQNTAGDPFKHSQAGAEFGFSLAVGNFNGDKSGSGHKIDDLAIGSPFQTVNTLSNAGIFTVFYGTGQGITSRNATTWWQGKNGTPHKPAVNDQMGYSLAAGDFNGDGRADLVVGSPGNSPNPAPTFKDAHQAGSAFVYYGGSNGIQAANAHTWDESTNLVKGDCIPFSHLGRKVVTGDFNGDGYADFAVNIVDDPGGPNLGTAGEGAVLVFYGSANGITAAGDQLFAQLNSGINEAVGVGTVNAAANNHFGSTLLVSDVNGDGKKDLTIKDAHGNTVVLLGSSSGLH